MEITAENNEFLVVLVRDRVVTGSRIIDMLSEVESTFNATVIQYEVARDTYVILRKKNSEGEE